MKSRKFLFYNFGFFNPAIDIYGLILRNIVIFFFYAGIYQITNICIFIYLLCIDYYILINDNF